MAEQIKKSQTPSKPAQNPKPMTPSSSGTGSPATKPTNPKINRK